MKNLNVFILDPDEMFLRRLSEVVEAAEGITVMDTPTGESEEDLMDTIIEAGPDALLLGINSLHSREMALFDLLRKHDPRLPVIVMPQHSREGADITLRALKSGAVEYINKTRSRTGSYHTREHFSKWLVPVIKALPRLNRKILASTQNIHEAIKGIDRISLSQFEESLPNMDLLTIVGCLGGIPALYKLLSTLPENLPVPVVVVQHMPKIFSRALAEDLDRYADIDVREATDGIELQAGQAYIAPGGYYARVERHDGRKTISVTRETHSSDYRPSMDVMLNSLQSVFKNRVLAVYLSGGGSDGIEAAKQLDRAGSQIIIQNRQTSLLWDLPQKIDFLAIDEGVYPLDRLGHQITSRINSFSKKTIS